MTASILALVLPALTLAEPDHGRQRIERIVVSGDGESGQIHARSEFVTRNKTTVYEFGGTTCRSYKMNPIVLEQLFLAMRAGNLIHVTSKTIKETACVVDIGFFARNP